MQSCILLFCYHPYLKEVQAEGTKRALTLNKPNPEVIKLISVKSFSGSSKEQHLYSWLKDAKQTMEMLLLPTVAMGTWIYKHLAGGALEIVKTELGHLNSPPLSQVLKVLKQYYRVPYKIIEDFLAYMMRIAV